MPCSRGWIASQPLNVAQECVFHVRGTVRSDLPFNSIEVHVKIDMLSHYFCSEYLIYFEPID